MEIAFFTTQFTWNIRDSLHSNRMNIALAALQKPINIAGKHLLWDVCKNSEQLKATDYFCKSSNVDIWQGSECASTLMELIKPLSGAISMALSFPNLLGLIWRKYFILNIFFISEHNFVKKRICKHQGKCIHDNMI